MVTIATRTVATVHKVVAEESKHWPSTVKVAFTYDNSDFIGRILKILESGLLSASLLVMLIVVASYRFVRTGRLIDDETTHSAHNIRTELVLSLVLIMAALAAYVALD